MRRHESMTPDEQREIDALERALAGDPVDPDLLELEELVHDIRATAPEMSPGFAARLHKELEDGFPTQAARPRPARRRLRILAPAAGSLAALLVAVVVVLGGQNAMQPTPTSGGRDDSVALDSAPAPESSGPAVEDSSAGEESSSSAGSGAAAAPPPPAAQPKAIAPNTAAAPAVRDRRSSAKPGGTRKVERNATLVIETPDGEFESTSDAVVRTVGQFDGIVADMSTSSGDGSAGEALFNLRIPTEKLDAALAALSKLGHVAERSQNLQDITGSFTSAQDRLSDARAERRGLLRALGKATTQAQIDSLRGQLRTVRGRIARLNGDLAALRNRADLSSVSLTVRGGGQDDGGAVGDPWTPGDAANDAVRVLEVIAGVLIIALAIAVPLALLGLVGIAGARLGRRRGRERALDAA